MASTSEGKPVVCEIEHILVNAIALPSMADKWYLRLVPSIIACGPAPRIRIGIGA